MVKAKELNVKSAKNDGKCFSLKAIADMQTSSVCVSSFVLQNFLSKCSITSESE